MGYNCLSCSVHDIEGSDIVGLVELVMRTELVETFAIYPYDNVGLREEEVFPLELLDRKSVV